MSRVWVLWCWLASVCLLCWPPSGHTAAPRQSSPASDSPPAAITARVLLDPGWQFPLVHVREAVIYRLHIDRDAQVLVLPESVTPEALRRALVRSTTLAPELFDVVQTAQHTAELPNERLRDTVEFTLRFSKPGVYSIPALPVLYSLDKSRRTSHTLQSAPPQGHILTVDAHLPIGTGALPGDILAPPPLAPYAWAWLRYLALTLLSGGVLALLVGVLLRVPQRRQPRGRKRLSGRRLRQKYQTEVQHLQQRTPTPAGPLSPEARAWLRDSATLLRRLLGEWSSGEPARFAGGAGVSATMVLAHLQLATPAQEASFQPALHLLEELDALATAPTTVLTVEDYQRLGDTLQHIILQLTRSEVSRVFRRPTRL